MHRLLSVFVSCLLLFPSFSYADIRGDLSNGNSLLSAITNAANSNASLESIFDQLFIDCKDIADPEAYLANLKALEDKEAQLENLAPYQPEIICSNGSAEATVTALVTAFINDREALAKIGQQALKIGLTEAQLTVISVNTGADITALLAAPAAGAAPAALQNTPLIVPFGDNFGRGGGGAASNS